MGGNYLFREEKGGLAWEAHVLICWCVLLFLCLSGVLGVFGHYLTEIVGPGAVYCYGLPGVNLSGWYFITWVCSREELVRYGYWAVGTVLGLRDFIL